MFLAVFRVPVLFFAACLFGLGFSVGIYMTSLARGCDHVISPWGPPPPAAAAPIPLHPDIPRITPQ